MSRHSSFNNKLCTECAYRKGTKCTLNNRYIYRQTNCPDGYTTDLLEMIERSYNRFFFTGKHTDEFMDWEPLLPDAEYPVMLPEEKFAVC